MSSATATISTMISTMQTPLASVSASSGVSTGGMDSNSCKISMTWNWYTVGACFISKTWQVNSSGLFAATCIGVIFLVMSLEFLRRLQREYEARCRQRDFEAFIAIPAGPALQHSSASRASNGSKGVAIANSHSAESTAPPRQRIDRMTLIQRHVIHSFIHMIQFGVAYFVMLLAMYYNGYIIICILIGAFLGALVFNFDQVRTERDARQEASDTTGCCG